MGVNRIDERDMRDWLEKIERKLDAALARQAEHSTALAVQRQQIEQYRVDCAEMRNTHTVLASSVQGLRKDLDAHTTEERTERRVLAAVAAGIGALIPVIFFALKHLFGT